MMLDVNAVLRDAWAAARRDRDVLLGVAGLFVFVPDLVQTMFVAPPPVWPDFSDRVAADAWMAQVGVWAGKYELIVLSTALLSLFGALALFTLYADRARPTVAAALGRSAALLPYYLLLAIATTIPVTLGYAALVVPGLYLKGRLLTISPVFVAERPIGVFAAWRRSFALTRGHGLVLMGLACVPLLGGWLLALPFDVLGKAAGGAPMANPVVAAVLNIGLAGAHTVAVVAAILIEVTLYRRLNTGT